jgi:demethylmenaquinone methyltransferase/2-methoxy-6-polyprenyl-1,4-benzoquinol methylase
MDQINGRPLRKMFWSVSNRYDMLNSFFTLGLDKSWRNKAVKELLKGSPQKILDLGTGTGDLAINLSKHAIQPLEVFAVDFSQPMLDVAIKKAQQKNLNGITFMLGDSAQLPFDKHFFDKVGTSFAFRNLTHENPDTELFFSEIIRVLKPGGNFVAVDTGQPSNKIVRKLFHLYLNNYTAPLGGLISGKKEAYSYLAKSATNFDGFDKMHQRLKNFGFRSVEYKPLLGGVAAIWDCKK